MLGRFSLFANTGNHSNQVKIYAPKLLIVVRCVCKCFGFRRKFILTFLVHFNIKACLLKGFLINFFQNYTSVVDSKNTNFLNFIFFPNARRINVENTPFSYIFKTGPQLWRQKYTNFMIFILNSRLLNVENTLISSIFKTTPQLWTQKYTNFLNLFLILDH